MLCTRIDSTRNVKSALIDRFVAPIVASLSRAAARGTAAAFTATAAAKIGVGVESRDIEIAFDARHRAAGVEFDVARRANGVDGNRRIGKRDHRLGHAHGARDAERPEYVAFHIDRRSRPIGKRTDRGRVEFGFALDAHRRTAGGLPVERQREMLGIDLRGQIGVLVVEQRTGTRDVDGQIDRFAVPSDAAVEIERRIEVGQGQPDIDVVETFFGAGLAVRVNNGAVGDGDIAQTDLVQEAGAAARSAAAAVGSAVGRAGLGGLEFPIGFAGRIDFEANGRGVEDEFIDRKLAPEEREQRHLKAQGAEFDHVGIGRAGRVGDGDLFEREFDRRDDRHADIARNGDLTPGSAFHLVFDLRAQGVFGHQRRENEDDDHEDDDERGQTDQKFFHENLFSFGR